MFHPEHPPQHMVIGTDLTGRTEHIATGAFGTDEVPQLSTEFKATALAGGSVGGALGDQAEVVVGVGGAGET